MWSGGLNPYDIYRDCDSNSIKNSFRMDALRFGLTPRKFLSKYSLTRFNYKNIENSYNILNSYIKVKIIYYFELFLNH